MPKTKGFFAEFKQFITRGNVIDLAVGVIVGAAFQKIINSLVNDLIMPIIGLVTGGIDFTNRFFALDGNTYDTIAQAKAAGAATFNYGSFFTEVLNFLIMAFVIFLMIKAINRLTNLSFHKKGNASDEKEETPSTKICPFCQSEISVLATKCPNCTSDLE